MKGTALTGGGVLITFEGGDGAGKSTQIERLSAILQRSSIPHVTTREPGGCPQGEAIREILLQGDIHRWDSVSEALLMAAARRRHLLETIWPAMEKGLWVLCDRFADSTWAYQGYGHGLGEGFVRQLNGLTMGHFQPHVTFIFSLSFEQGIRRKKKQHSQLEDRFERLGDAFHQRVQTGYNMLLQHEPQRCIPVDAAAPVEQITQKLVGCLIEKGLLAKELLEEGGKGRI
jgi:dTMP kinase